MFASLFFSLSLSLSIRFLFSSRVFDATNEEREQKMCFVPPRRRAKSTAKEDDDDEYRVVFRAKRKENVSKR